MAWFNTWKSLASIALWAIVSTWPALAQENGSSLKVDETKASVQTKTTNVIAWYDKDTNTLTIPSSPWVTIWWPIDLSTVDVLNKTKFKDVFDLNKDWKISLSEIELKFEINLSDFNAIYKWDLSFFEKNSEIVSKRQNIADLMEKRQTLTEEQDIKKINKSIVLLNEEINRKLNNLYIEYFELFSKKVNYVLKNDDLKLLFLSYLPKESDLENFKSFVSSNLNQNISKNQEIYEEVSYIKWDVFSRLLTPDQNVDEKFFSKDEIEKFSSSFYNLRDVYNARVLSFELNQENVFEFLSDLNNDWKLNSNDKAEVYGLQLLSILKEVESQLNLTNNNADFYSNLSYIFSLWGIDVKVNSKDELVKLFWAVPEAKFSFYDGIKILIIQGWDLAYTLKYWKKWIEEFNKLKQKVYNSPMVWMLVSKIESWLWNIAGELSKIKANGLITDKEYAEQLAMIEKYKLEPWFEDKIFEYAVWLLSSISATYLSETSNNSWAKMEYTKTIFNPQIQKITKKFIDSLTIDLWVASTANWNMLMVWLWYKSDYSISETEKLTSSLWARAWLWTSSNVLPFLGLSYTKITNLEDVKKAWFKEFDLTKNSFKVWVDYSMINIKWANLWFFAWWSEDRMWALEIKYAQYKSILDNVFEYDSKLSLKDYLSLVSSRLESQDYKDIWFLASNLDLVSTSLETLWFDKVDTISKKRLIEVVKLKLSQDFLNYYANIEEAKWWELSHFWARVSLLSKATWLAALPSLWWTKIENIYETNSSRNTLWKVSSELFDWETLDFSIYQGRFLKDLEKFLNVKWLSIICDKWLLKLTSKDWGDVFELLSKSWLNIFIESDEKIISQVWYENNAILIWDIWSLWLFVDSWKDWRNVSMVVWTWWISKKLALTKDTKIILENNFPSSITKLDVKSKNLVLPNSQKLTKKYFWI